MTWIQIASLTTAILNGTIGIYTWTVNHRHPPYKGKHRKKPKRKNRR